MLIPLNLGLLGYRIQKVRRPRRRQLGINADHVTAIL